VINSVTNNYNWSQPKTPNDKKKKLRARGDRWEPVKASEQQIIDCSEYTNGCVGGFYTSAWAYAKKRGFMATDASYPYSAKVSKTRKRPDF